MRHRITIPDGQKWTGFCKNKIRELDKQRRRLRLRFMKKTFYVGDAYIMLYTSDKDQWYYIFGGGTGQILFAYPGSGDTGSSVYNYLTSTISDAISVTGVPEDVLHQNFNGSCHYGEIVSLDFGNNTWSSTTLDETLTHIANSQPYELELLTKDTSLYVRQGGTTSEAVTLPLASWQYEYAQSQDDFIYLPRVHAGMWNLINGLELWIYAPATGNFFPSAWWVPNISYAESGNGSLTTGFYYGNIYDQWIGRTDPTPETPGYASFVVKVTFGALLDNRKPNALKPYSYAEVLTTMDGELFNNVYFYLSGSPIPDYGNPSILYQGLLYNRDCGTEMHGKNWDFYIRPSFDPPLGFDYTVSFWNLPDEREATELQPVTDDYCGIVISSDSNAEVWWYDGSGVAMLYETTNYHSHSYSTDGTILAVFEGDIYITNTVVIDMQTSQTLASSSLMENLNATSGAYIPVRRDNWTPTFTHPDSPQEVVDDLSQLDFVAPFGWVLYNKLIPQGLYWRKIVNTDGIHAQSVEYDDECMDGNVSIIRPNTIPPVGEFTITVGGDSYTGSWSEVSTMLPNTLWSAAGLPHEIALCTWSDAGPYGVPVSVTIDNGSVDTIYVPVLSIGYDPVAGYSTSGGLGDVSDITEYDDPINDTCGNYEYVGATANDSCGNEAEYVIVIPPASGNPSISGDKTVITVGTVYTASGGTPPYQNWVFSGGSGTVSTVTETNDTFTVTSITACAASGEQRYSQITVEDDCNNSALLAMSLTGGDWCCVEDNTQCGASSSFDLCSATYGFDIDTSPPEPNCSRPFFGSAQPRTVHYTGDIGGFTWAETFGAVSGDDFPVCCEQHYGIIDGYDADSWGQSVGGAGACMEWGVGLEYLCP